VVVFLDLAISPSQYPSSRGRAEGCARHPGRFRDRADRSSSSTATMGDMRVNLW